MAIISCKLFNEMTLAELEAEWAQWNDGITRGVFNSALALAIDYRDLCATWMARRTREARRSMARAS